MNAVAAMTDYCVRHRRAVILLVLALAVLSGAVAVRRFAIDTNTNDLMPASLPWVRREHRYQQEFPPQRIVAVVRAPTPEMADDAAARLRDALQGKNGAIEAVQMPQGGAFLARAGLLFRPLPEVERSLGQLDQARPVLGALAMDPSLRGVMDVAARMARQQPSDAGRPSRMLGDVAQTVVDGTFASFSWQALMQGKTPKPADLRQLLLIAPKLDFRALQPGLAAENAIRSAARRQDIAGRNGATVRLTGEAAINDDQFSTLSRGAALNGAGTALAVLVILFLALRSGRIVLAVVINLLAGLAITAALGLLVVGPFNLISIAFAVLFVGLGADFGIQFSVRYRAERHEHDDIDQALGGAARKAGGALALAACSVTAGFCSFVPTDYRGIAELGEVAGMGMIVAFLLTMTLLPALLALFRSSGEPERLGYAFLAPVDRFLGAHRIAVVAGTVIVVLAGTPLLTRLQFDFDPMHLQDPNSEAVRTYSDLTRDPGTGVAAVDVAAPSLADARALARRLEALPGVQGTRTVDTLIPADQAPKIAAIGRAAPALLQALDPPQRRPAPTDAEDIAALRMLADALPRGDAEDRLRGLLRRIADGPEAQRTRLADALIVPLRMDLDRLRAMLRPERVTTADLPEDLRRDWLSPGGRARVQILPRGDATNTRSMADFARQVQSVAPEASGTAITLLESRRTVLRAFIEAGLCAVLAIALILYVTLRRIGDVLLTLVPLIVAALVTLEVTVLIGQDLNFANVIALPLLLGVGVAFKIYYILAWRRGATNLLQSTLTRAIFFSALTTMTAFGSLWLSNQPGMSSMGKLMALALLCTLLAAVLFQPALMGPPRQKEGATGERGTARQYDLAR